MVSASPPPPPRRSISASPGWSALIALVTLVAVLLTCRIKVRSIEWRFEYPLMSLRDPTRSLFSFAEHDRREVQSGALPRWLSVNDGCSACDESSLTKRWDELIDEQQRYREDGYQRHTGAKFLIEAEAARDISLAGWGDPKRIAALDSLNTGALPDYLAKRGDELRRGDDAAERARTRDVGRSALVNLVVHVAFMLFALGAVVVWHRGFGYPRRPARSRLAAPELGRGLVVFLWAEGFVSVLTRLRWDNPDSPLAIFGAIPSLSTAVSICILLIGTRASPTETPLEALYRCPADRRSRIIMVAGALSTIGLIYGFNWLSWRVSLWVGYSPRWQDGMRESIVYGSAVQAYLARFGSVVVAPFAEELAYRGVLFGSLAPRLGAHRAALVSCLVFAAAHGYGWHGFASVALSGYLWARLAGRTGSLVPSTIAHGVFNLIWSFAVFAWRT